MRQFLTKKNLFSFFLVFLLLATSENVMRLLALDCKIAAEMQTAEGSFHFEVKCERKDDPYSCLGL